MGQVRIRLTAEHFSSNHRTIYQILERFYDRYGTVLEADLFSAMLTGRPDAEPAKVVVYEQLFRRLAESNVQDHRFAWAVDALVDRVSDRETGDAIQTGLEILVRGWTDPKGDHAVVLEGHNDARAYLHERLSAIDRAEYGQHAPEGDMRHEVDWALTDYAARKEREMEGSSPGVRSGIGCIDRTIGGLMPGELALIAGYTTVGKSHSCTQWAWHVAVEEGGDVAFFTTETVRDQVKRRLYARHSRLPQFERPGGLNSKEIRNGTLSPADEAVFHEVVDDMDRNPKYGVLHLAQVPYGAPLSYVESRLREVGRRADVKLCVIDYLALLQSDKRRERAHEEYNDILRGAKQMATSYAQGAGVPVISPWQVQQSAYREGKKNRAYTLTNLADTSEAEKVSDTIMALLREEDDFRSARLQFLKVRDGDLPPPAELEIDLRNSYLTDRSLGLPSVDGGTVTAGMRSELEEFLNG